MLTSSYIRQSDYKLLGWVSFFVNLLLLLTLIFAPLAHANDPQALPKPLRIALPTQEAINATENKSVQNLVNFLREYWQIWAIDNDTEVTFVSLPATQMYDALSAGEIDVAAINLYEKDANLLFSIPYAKFEQRVYHRIAGNETDGIELAIHSSTQTTLNFLRNHVKRTYFDDLDDLVANYKSFDVLYSEKPWLLSKKLREQGINNKFYVTSEEVPVDHLRFAVSKENRALMLNINTSLRKVSALQTELWTKKYLADPGSILSLSLGNYILSLSDEEQEYILDNNELLYPLSETGFPPYLITKSFTNLTESGYTIDLLTVITEKTGVVFKPLYVDKFADSLAAVSQGKAAFFAQIESNRQREATFLFSRPYLKANYNIVFRQQYELKDDKNNLHEEVIAAVENYNPTIALRKRYPNAQFKMYNSVEEALIGVSTGDADIFIGRTLTSAYLINKLTLSNLASLPLEGFQKNAHFSFATVKSSSTLITILNRAISSISGAQFDDIYTRWSQTVLTNEAQGQLNYIYRQVGYASAFILIVILVIAFIYYRQRKLELIAKNKVEHALAIAESARAQAEKSAQAKITFLARMSHEIRTPMNGVLGMAEALTYTSLNKNQTELLDTLNASANNLLALLNDILDFSKMDAGKLTLELVPTNLAKLALDIIGSFEHVRSNHKVKLTTHIDPALKHYYLTDPTRISQVLNNLLSNATKFTEQGEISLTINKVKRQTIGDKTYDTLSIAVKDSGIGISEEHQGNLFTPFIQADDDVTRKYGGTGLGLSICQEIVMAMGSKIRINSIEGIGSEFYFILDFQHTHLATIKNERRKSTRVIATENDDRFKNIRVLVAEDNLVNTKVLTAQLSRLNITADVAEDGEKALEMYLANPYDIVLSDCHMPNMDGFELARNIKHLTAKSHRVWLIAITADALTGAADNCIAAGFDDYMAKPCPQEEIANKLNHAYRNIKNQQEKTKIKLN